MQTFNPFQAGHTFSLCIVLLLLSGCAFPKTQTIESYQTGERYPVVAAIHGVKQTRFKDDLREIVLSYTPTPEIPRNTNTFHGWMIQIKRTEAPIKFTEIYILPARARWFRSRGVVSADGRVHTYSSVLPKGMERLSSSWGMCADDPVGNYEILVLLQDKLAADFKFKVVAPTNAPVASR